MATVPNVARTREFDTGAAVDAAMSAFRRKGFEGTSVQDLVDATGIGRGSLYLAFGSKEELYLAAVDRYRERFAVPLAEALRMGEPGPELIREVFVGLVDEIVRDARERACLVAGAAMERAHQDPAVAARLKATTTAIEDALFDVVVRARTAGRLPDRGDASGIARFLVTAMQGLRVMGAIDPDRDALLRTVDVTLDCLR